VEKMTITLLCWRRRKSNLTDVKKKGCPTEGETIFEPPLKLRRHAVE